MNRHSQRVGAGKSRTLIVLAVLLLGLTSCQARHADNGQEIKQDTDIDMKTIYFAGGCFWGTQHFFSLVPGVVATQTGYANSQIPDPSYKEVCSGRTDAAETVKVTYDPDSIPLADLVRLYFLTIDPTTVNRQGNDRGTQYRTGIYYTDPQDLASIRPVVEAVARDYAVPIRVEVEPLRNFYPAEDYHQDYLDRNPGGYCHIDPALFRVAAGYRPSRKVGLNRYGMPVGETESELRERLTPLQYEVTRHAATERPFDNEYNAEHRKGIYVDVIDGTPLFVSTDKFDSGCGWPAFSRPVSEDAVTARRDLSHGMDRVEVLSASSGAHLGHVFPDGPRDRGGMRYCINSASLRFIPLEAMSATPYAGLIPLVR